MRRVYYVYILANRSRTLYVGVPSNLAHRVYEHREGLGSKFVSRYAIHQLVHVECAPNPHDAIAREKQLKRWSAEEDRLDRGIQPRTVGYGGVDRPSTGMTAIPRFARNDKALPG